MKLHEYYMPGKMLMTTAVPVLVSQAAATAGPVTVPVTVTVTVPVPGHCASDARAGGERLALHWHGSTT